MFGEWLVNGWNILGAVVHEIFDGMSLVYKLALTTKYQQYYQCASTNYQSLYRYLPFLTNSPHIRYQ